MAVKRMVAIGVAAAGLALSGVALTAPGTAHAAGCGGADDVQFGGGGGPFGNNGGAWADCHFAPDGSYDHCVTVRVLGFGGMQCTRVGP